MDTSSIFCFLFLLAVAAIYIVAIAKNSGLCRDELRSVAERWNGHVDAAGIFKYDEVIFWICEQPARLHFSRRGKRGRNTHVSIQFPDRSLRIELYSAGELRKLLKVEDVEVGAPYFDENFVITGNRPEEIRDVLTEPAQAAITAVANLDAPFIPDLHLSISNGVLRITKHSSAGDNGGLMRLLVHFEAMYHALTVNHQPHIEFVTEKQPPKIHDTHCKVCGEPLHTNIVACSTCQTPHHLDCWQYFGSCAVYGCGQKRYTQPRRT